VEHFEDPNNHLPQGKQSPESILSLCESLRNRFGQVSGRSHGLTKAERLQICDLAPTELVEIYLVRLLPISIHYIFVYHMSDLASHALITLETDYRGVRLAILGG
jgi:hypothetical protein